MAGTCTESGFCLLPLVPLLLGIGFAAVGLGCAAVWGPRVPAELFERVGRSWRLLRVIPIHAKASGNIDPPIEVP